VATANGAAAANRRIRHAHRSGGSSSRHTPIPNPVTDERIAVGTWAHSASASPNAVIAGFDQHGRIFYRITNLDLYGASVGAATSTAVRFEDINFRAPYQGMDAATVRLAVDRHLRMPSYARP
jgi:hypothetical protein